jgi:hypothetical protein
MTAWTIDPQPPEPKTGPSWTPDAAALTQTTGPSWFSLTERVIEFSAEGTLSVDIGVAYPAGVAVFHATGTLSCTIAPVKAIAAAFSAVGGLSATVAQRKSISVNLSASTDGLQAMCNDGLWCLITGGDAEVHDGLTCTIKGGGYDGLRATITPIVDGLTVQLEKQT